jgi:hypothetical protein
VENPQPAGKYRFRDMARVNGWLAGEDLERKA